MTVTVQLRSASGATFTKTLPDPVVTNLPAPWVNNDIGNPALAGSASFANNIFTVKGGGADIWGSIDQLHFAHQPLAADGQIVAHVKSQTGATNTWAKAGVMIKQSTTAGSPYALMTVTPDVQGTAFQAGFNVSAQTTLKTWLKLTRVGSTVTGYSSSDGVTWTQLGTFTLAGTARIGLFVSSHSDTQLCTATFDNVTVGAVPAQPPSGAAFFDDFNGAAGSPPNPAVWAVSTQSWTGGIQTYQTSQVFLDGLGNCVIEAKQSGTTFISGAFCGKSGPYPKPGAAVPLSWGYGRMESRIKMPRGFPGSWPAWWFLGEEFDGSSVAPNGWPFCGEFDIMEGFSDSKSYYATMHGTGGDPNNASNQAQVFVPASVIGVADFADDYHVYWSDRRANTLTVGVDAKTLATFTPASLTPAGAQWNLNKNVFPIFDFMLYGNPVGLPARMLIDWVRFTPATP